MNRTIKRFEKVEGENINITLQKVRVLPGCALASLRGYGENRYISAVFVEVKTEWEKLCDSMNH